jgi:hypothetical protein
VLRLGRGVTVAGRCIDTDGHPVKVDAAFRAVDVGGPLAANELATLYSMKVDSDGRFAITSVPAGRFVIQVPPEGSVRLSNGEAGWTAQPVIFDTHDGPVENLALVVHRAVPLILQPASKECAEMQYRVATLDGLSYASGGFIGSSAERVGLAPGQYVLRLSRDRRSVREIPFTLGVTALTLNVSP